MARVEAGGGMRFPAAAEAAGECEGGGGDGGDGEWGAGGDGAEGGGGRGDGREGGSCHRLLMNVGMFRVWIFHFVKILSSRIVDMHEFVFLY